MVVPGGTAMEDKEEDEDDDVNYGYSGRPNKDLWGNNDDVEELWPDEL